MAIQQTLRESDYEQILKAGERLEAKCMQRGLEKGLQQGLQQGLERGLQQGLEKGLQRQRAMVQRLLQLRFGELPAWALDRVKAADTDALDKMAEQLLGASSLVEALGEGSERGKAPRLAPRRRRKPR